MSDDQEAPQSEEQPTQVSDAMPFSAFLEDIPPTQWKVVDELALRRRSTHSTYYVMDTPQLRLYCGDDGCNGMRIFRYTEDNDGPIIREGAVKYVFLVYRCSNCQNYIKTFSVAAIVDGTNLGGRCYKFGELPTFGPTTPSQLISLIGPDRVLFLKGRQCENQGLGIGAFVYYRRVVENQRDRIFERIIKVCERLSADPETISVLRAAQRETQFKRALEAVKTAIPQSLLINGYNPLTLLHSALSDGLHGKGDEECLELAQDIRTVLAELAERLAQALKDEAELNAAIARLARARGAPN